MVSLGPWAFGTLGSDLGLIGLWVWGSRLRAWGLFLGRSLLLVRGEVFIIITRCVAIFAVVALDVRCSSCRALASLLT